MAGLFLGGIYALLSVGFSLTWGIMKVLNLSHAVFGVLAAYTSYWLLQKVGLDPLLSLLLVVPLFFVGGGLLYRFLIAPLGRARDIPMASTVLTFGLAIVVENSMAYFWKPDPRLLRTAYIGAALSLGELRVPLGPLLGFLLAVVGIALIYFFLHSTYTGKAVQATWQDPEGATLVGIALERVSVITFGLALASAGAAGVALALLYAFYPTVHYIWLLFIFLVTILGGVGSVVGTIAGGLVIGFIFGMAATFLPFAWVNTTLFALLLIILLVRPTGLFRM
jgi:branched-chain amino acid transport system permease protein